MFRENSIMTITTLTVSWVLAIHTLLIPIGMAPTVTAQNNGQNENASVPDPCQQALNVPGNANGLHKRCDAIGTGAGAAKGDFNGDGFADLAVGVPNEGVNGLTEAGGVNVMYGSASGLTSVGDQFIDETKLNFPGQSYGNFGWSLAAGDFNGDGFVDLAIGEPHIYVDNGGNDAYYSGRVFVVYGSSNGLILSAVQQIAPDYRSDFGAALVWGDFNGDGKADLAIGNPGAKIFTGLIDNHGVVEVLYGSSIGLVDSTRRILRQGSPGTNSDGTISVGGFAEGDDFFGGVLAASRRGTYDDLIIGVPFEDVGLTNPKKDAGVVHVVKGSSSGLTPSGIQIFSQADSDVQGEAETEDQFGRSLAIGDFNGDGRDDLAVGVPFEDLANSNAGAVQIFFGSSGSDVFTTNDNRFLSQAVIPGVAVEYNDRMGWALATGDFDRDGRDDLAIGVPGEDLGTVLDAGLVTILYGSASGASLTRYQHWTQDTAGIPGVAEPYDQFGYSLSAWNYGYGLEADLAIGVPYEDIPNAPDCGSVNVIYGSPSGLSATAHPAQIWNQDSPNIKGIAQSFDHFGQSLY
ncbi:MAG: FG-GAP-like repeat-containing protein [Acidobacteriota bacterium]